MTDTPTPVIPTKVGTQGDKDPADTGSRPVQAMTDDELAEACQREIARIDAEQAARIRRGIG